MAAAAAADTVTYDLLDGSADWTYGSNRGRGTLVNEVGELSVNTLNWGQGAVTRELTNTIELAQTDTFNFTYTVETKGSSNVCATLSLIGSTGAIVVGPSYNSDGRDATPAPVQYGTTTETDTIAHMFKDGWGNYGTAITSLGSLTEIDPTATLTINGEVAWSESDQLFKLTLTAGGSSATVNLGQTFDVSSVAVGFDAASNHTPSVNALSLSVVSTPAVPEPATATLSLLALAGLAVRRRRAL